MTTTHADTQLQVTKLPLPKIEDTEDVVPARCTPDVNKAILAGV